MTRPLSRSLGRAGFVLTVLLGAEQFLPPALPVGPAPAQAIVGRPASPVSVAGVARRTTRRTVVATSAVAASATPTTVVVVENPPPPPPAGTPPKR